MKSFITLLIAVLLVTVSARAQPADVSQWLKKKMVDGKEIIMLRVPDTQVGLVLLGPISDAQFMLGRLPSYYNITGSSAATDMYRDIEKHCATIERENPSFPVHYYRDEVKAFQELKEEVAQKAVAKKKADEEVAFFPRLKADYAWTSSESSNVYTKPDEKSASIGMIGRLSYIKAYDVEDNENWVQIEFGEHSGYLRREQVAIDWDELAPSHEDSSRLENGQFHYFKPTAAYTAQLKKAAADEERSLSAANAAPRRKYYVGPRGGCYYINSSGNKQYVDHSYCK